VSSRGHGRMSQQLYFQSEQLDFQFMRALAASAYGGATPGECLAAADRIEEAKRASWINAWTDLAARVEQSADDAAASGHQNTAGDAYLRAFTYHRAAAQFALSTEAEAKIEYDRGVRCFRSSMKVRHPKARAIDLPYRNGVTLPGYYFPASGGGSAGLLVIVGGGDASGEEMYFLGGVPEANRRGYDAIIFHGPGHRGALLKDSDLVFRPDYEVVISAVLDYALTTQAVDPGRVAVSGYSLGGYLVLRAAAADHRIKAAVANSPIIDFAAVTRAAWEQQVDEPDPYQVNPEYRQYTANFSSWTFGVKSREDIERMPPFVITKEDFDRIECPVLSLVSEAESDELRHQARAAHDSVQHPAKILRSFTSADCADAHVQVNNLPLSHAVTYDWLDDVLGISDGRKRSSAQG